MMSKRTTKSLPPLKQSPQPWLPLPYMKKAVKWLLEHACAALFLDPGLRKTSITLAAFSFLLKKKIARRMLVIAPLRVAVSVWPDEIAKWKDFSHLRVVVLHGRRKEELLASNADVYVINPEGLEWLIFGPNNPRKIFDPRRWKKFGFDTLVIDELTKFKHPKGVRFKALKHVLDYFGRRWGLTGSPAANGLLDLFGQCYVLDLGNALGRFITHYRLTYFTNPDKQGWTWVLRPGSKELIYERIKPLALRMDANDYLDLPPLIDKWEPLELPKEVRKLYDELEEDLIARIESGEVVAANSASASMKLRQIVNGGLYVDNDVAAIIGGKARRTLVLHDVKTDWLEDLVDELQGQPLLVAYQFDHDLERLKARFGKDLPHIGGGVSIREGRAHETNWNAGAYPMMAVHPASAGHGLNLQGSNAAHLAMYSMTYDFDQYDQLIRRILRSGTKAKRIFRYHAVMRNSVDEDQRYSLRRKDTGQRSLFDALKARHR